MANAMLKYILAIIYLVLAAAQFAVAQDETSADDAISSKPKITESKIRGRVIYEDTGKPVRHGALVLLDAVNLNQLRGSKTTTDDRGGFVMPQIPAGTYYPSIEVAGILNPFSYQAFFGPSSYEQKISPRKLDAFFRKITMDGVNDAEVVITVKRAGAIAGRVTYFDGEAAPGMQVEALRKSADGYEKSGGVFGTRGGGAGVSVTDDRGCYRFSGLPPGKYIVYIQEKAEHIPASYPGEADRPSELKTYYPNAQSSKDAKPVEIMIGGQQEGVDITIPDRKTYKLSGKVVSKFDKKPPAGIEVRFRRTDDTEQLKFVYTGQQSVYTDAEGKWTINDLPNGKYRIDFEPHNSSDGPAAKPGEKNPPRFGNTSLAIQMDGASQESLVTEMPFESGISGTVRVEGGKTLPKSMLIVSMRPHDYQSTGFGQVVVSADEKSGNFRVENARSGENTMFLYIENNSGFYAKSIKWGSTDLLTSTVQVNEGEETTGVEIVLSDEVGILKGKVAGDDGSFDYPRMLVTPVDRGEIDSMNRSCSPLPNEGGEFECNLAPGEYFVTFHKGGTEEEHWEDWYKRQSEGAMKVTITEGETTKITLKLPSK